jgi:hypothetical protein
MKKILAALTVLFVTVSVNAQMNKDEMSYIQSLWGMEKREIVKKAITLDENESKGFWSVYDTYEDARKELGKERINTIIDYTENVEKMTNEKADELALKLLSNQTKFIELLGKAYDKMKAAVSQIKAFQFVLLENYLDTALKLKVVEQLPFVGGIKK